MKKRKKKGKKKKTEKKQRQTETTNIRTIQIKDIIPSFKPAVGIWEEAKK